LADAVYLLRANQLTADGATDFGAKCSVRPYSGELLIFALLEAKRAVNFHRWSCHGWQDLPHRYQAISLRYAAPTCERKTGSTYAGNQQFRVYSRFVPNLTRRDGSVFERLLQSVFRQGLVTTTQQLTLNEGEAHEAITSKV